MVFDINRIVQITPSTSVIDVDIKENVDARGNFNSVGERLNDTVLKIDKKLNISDCGFVRPEWMDSWNESDQTQAFKDCIKIITDVFKTNGLSNLSIRLRGKYSISSTLKLNSFVKFVTDATTQITFKGEGYLFHIVLLNY